MRKFFVIIVVLALVVIASLYAVFIAGAYIDFAPGAPVSVPFRADGTQLTRLMPDGTYQPLTLRGVDMSSAVAGEYATQFPADKETYLRWLEQIGEMGANAVRVLYVMDSDFYNALYTYNTTHEQPIYLLQGIGVTDFANNNQNDAYGSGFYDKLKRDLRSLTDIIHGRKAAFTLDLGLDYYRHDISPWVIGYLVGSEWVSDTIAYTNHNPLRSDSFQGEYFQTAPEASNFEAMLADVMDSVTEYESRKYKTQRPVGFINDPSNDFLEYGKIYAKQLAKHVRMDAENVLPTEAMRAGTFAAYLMYDFCDDFSSYLSHEQKRALAAILEGLEPGGLYDGYIELLARYHTMPVIATGYGYSSSRGAVRMDTPPLTEREQGEKLVEFSRELEAAGWAGGFISTWQDTWERRTWNTAYSSMTGRNRLWHDLQTDGQGYGLMSFDPVPTGWKNSDLVYNHDGIRIYAKYNEQGLHLLIEGISPEDTLYLPLDVSPKTGSTVSLEPSLTFERPADFLLCLSGTDNSRLLVQERYDSARQRFWFEMTGVNPYTHVPEADSPVFVPITMALENPLLIDEVTVEKQMLQRLGAWEAGKLTHGMMDPSSPHYNSLADFMFGDGFAEVRLPWMLLNFYDPTRMMVHDDYYKRYGVEGVSVKEIHIGAGRYGAEGDIPMSPIPLRGWNDNVKTEERLKGSYYIIKEAWGGPQ